MNRYVKREIKKITIYIYIYIYILVVPGHALLFVCLNVEKKENACF